MTTDSENTAGEIPPPPGSEQKLALDDFAQAIGDDELASAAPGNDEQPPLSSAGAAGLEALHDIPVNITVVLGRTRIEVSDLLALDKGDVVELDRKVGEAVDIFVNNRLVARGEVVLVDDRLGITMTEIIKGSPAAA